MQLTVVESLIWERIAASLALNPTDRRLPVTTWKHKDTFNIMYIKYLRMCECLPAVSSSHEFVLC